MQFDTKIAVVVREDLQTWQKLNITAFTVSGIAGTVEGIIGEPYEDGSGNQYLPNRASLHKRDTSRGNNTLRHPAIILCR